MTASKNSSRYRRAVTAEGCGRLPDPDVEQLTTRIPNWSGELTVQPPREYFDGYGPGIVGPDLLQVLVGHFGDGVGQCGIEHVEVTHPALAAQLFAFDNELESVVVRVQFSFRRRRVRHHMPGADFHGRPDAEHASSVAQRGVDQAVGAPVDSGECLCGVVECEVVGSERRERQLVEQRSR
jgi:hypothetical protein